MFKKRVDKITSKIYRLWQSKELDIFSLSSSPRLSPDIISAKTRMHVHLQVIIRGGPLQVLSDRN